MTTQPIKLTVPEISYLLTAAGRAPSGGNIQPWLVTVNQNTILITLNPNKLGTILDVNNYGSLFALGSFCLNLEIAANQKGLLWKQVLLHVQDQNKFSIKYTFLNRIKPIQSPLYQAVMSRDTNRRLSEKQNISKPTINKLKSIISRTNHKFRLDTISSNQDKSEMAKILGKADLIRTQNLTLLKQMMSEMRWTKKAAQETKDGLDIETMELPGNVGKMLELLSKFPSMAKTVPAIALEKQAWPLLKASSHLCTLTLLDEPSPQNLFDSGYVMQRLWLEATIQSLAIHPWTVLTFFTIRAKYFPNTAFSTQEEKLLLSMDEKLRHLLSLPSKKYTPIFIFRLSHAKPPSTRSQRYPWSKFTSVQ